MSCTGWILKGFSTMPATLHTTNIGRYVSEGITLLTFHFLLSAFDPIQQQTYIFSKWWFSGNSSLKHGNDYVMLWLLGYFLSWFLVLRFVYLFVCFETVSLCNLVCPRTPSSDHVAQAGLKPVVVSLQVMSHRHEQLLSTFVTSGLGTRSWPWCFSCPSSQILRF